MWFIHLTGPHPNMLTKIDAVKFSLTCIINCWICKLNFFVCNGFPQFLIVVLILVRYHCNRLALDVRPVVPFDNFRERLDEGYFPNMTTSTSSFTYAPRQNNAHLRDLRRDGDFTRVSDIERWYERLEDAVDNGYCLDVCIALVYKRKNTRFRIWWIFYISNDFPFIGCTKWHQFI